VCKDTAISSKHRIKTVKTTKFKGVNSAFPQRQRHERKKKEILSPTYQANKTSFKPKRNK